MKATYRISRSAKFVMAAVGAAVARHPDSTELTTEAATPSNAVSAGSKATGPWPPATTSSPSAIRPHYTSPRSTDGSHDHLLKQIPVVAGQDVIDAVGRKVGRG